MNDYEINLKIFLKFREILFLNVKKNDIRSISNSELIFSLKKTHDDSNINGISWFKNPSST